MLTALYIFLGIIAYFFIGGVSVAKLFGPYPSFNSDNQALYIIGIIFWPISVIIGAARKGVELVSRDED